MSQNNIQGKCLMSINSMTNIGTDFLLREEKKVLLSQSQGSSLDEERR